jgi:imidazole glycerol-phosphate synthase subunit HisH
LSPASPALVILDYGMGNRRSVEKAAEKVGATTTISADPEVIGSADGIILPGVGAFPRAMSRIRELGLDRMIREAEDAGVPILGICLGYQLLFDSSIELGGADGLGLLPGTVRDVPAGGRKVPHIGWAAVTWTEPSPLTDGMRPGEPFYFVHSFVPVPEESDTLGTTSYGGDFACVAARGRTFGAQFHPEKSSTAGLKMLENFVNICREPERVEAA